MPFDLATVFPIFGLSVLVMLVLLRVEKKAQWVAWVFMVAPSALVLLAWATWFARWREALVSVGGAAVLVGGWWLLRGRKLPPTASTIKVWGQDSAPKPKAADLVAMQEEIMRLQDEKALMETELKQLREGKGREVDM